MPIKLDYLWAGLCLVGAVYFIFGSKGARSCSCMRCIQEQDLAPFPNIGYSDGMIFGNESISQYSKSNVFLWMIMAFQAGMLNIGGFMACHRFVSHVTGFATFFGSEMSKGQLRNALGMLTVPLFFLFGAMLSGVLVDLPLQQNKKPRYYITFGVIFVLILSVAVAGAIGRLGDFGSPLETSQDYTLLILLCLTCGIQNGTVTTVSRSIVRTTHLTGITTDLGVGIIRLLNRHKIGSKIDIEKKASLMRIGIIAFFGFGSIVGGYAFSRFGYPGFFLPAMTSGGLFATMMYFQVFKKFTPEVQP